MFQQSCTGRSWARTGGAANKQRHPDLPFECADLLGDSRSRVVQHRGGSTQRSAAGHLLEHREPANIEHRFNLLSAHPDPEVCDQGEHKAAAVRDGSVQAARQ